MEQENEKTEIVSKNENKENKMLLRVSRLHFAQGGGVIKKNLIQGGSVPRCDPLSFIFLAQKIAFSYTFH